MLKGPAFFALLGAAGIAAVSYGCQLEEREPPAPNPRPGGGTPVGVGPGPGGTGATGGGGSSGTESTTATTTTGGGGGGGGDGGGGGAQTPAEVLFPFCGCMEAGSSAGACADCLWSPATNLCQDEWNNCNLGVCAQIQQQVQDGICDLSDPMCIETIVQGLEGGVGSFALYLECACTSCTLQCPASSCQ